MLNSGLGTLRSSLEMRAGIKPAILLTERQNCRRHGSGAAAAG